MNKPCVNLQTVAKDHNFVYKERDIRQELVSKLSDEQLAELASWRGAAPARGRNSRIDQIVERTWKPGRP